MTRFIVDMARRFKTASLAASQLGYRQLMPEQSEDNLHAIGTSPSVSTRVLECLTVKSPSRTTLRQVFEADGAALFLDSHGSGSVLDQLLVLYLR